MFWWEYHQYNMDLITLTHFAAKRVKTNKKKSKKVKEFHII